ncbi:hypothetical protein B0T10DRAFT_454757 [Thelonectria olida]|uniref:Uncharacterized protein n=1 Tax=Thelonectria olida TaxID=1576542 RepID=A0A9P8WDD4_9HYPO|nr:hypothetical protein B0T10DRAFT_454757 [Thelonectria olida]
MLKLVALAWAAGRLGLLCPSRVSVDELPKAGGWGPTWHICSKPDVHWEDQQADERVLSGCLAFGRFGYEVDWWANRQDRSICSPIETTSVVVQVVQTCAILRDRQGLQMVNTPDDEMPRRAACQCCRSAHHRGSRDRAHTGPPWNCDFGYGSGIIMPRGEA